MTLEGCCSCLEFDTLKNIDFLRQQTSRESGRAGKARQNVRMEESEGRVGWRERRRKTEEGCCEIR